MDHPAHPGHLLLWVNQEVVVKGEEVEGGRGGGWKRGGREDGGWGGEKEEVDTGRGGRRGGGWKGEEGEKEEVEEVVRMEEKEVEGGGEGLGGGCGG